MNRTMVLCKPDGGERGLVGEIVARLERRGLRIVAMELRTLDDDLARRLYDEHREKPFFGDLVNFITRGPLVARAEELALAPHGGSAEFARVSGQQWLSSVVGRDMAVDLGTANTVVYVRGQGIVLDEPSIVAINTRNQQLLA